MAEGDADLAIRSLSSTPNSRSLPDVALFSGEQFPKGHSFFIDCIDHAVPCAPQPCSSSDAAVAVVARRPASSMSWGKDANPSPGAGRQELHGLGQDKIMTHLQCGFRSRDEMTELGALSSLRSRDGDRGQMTDGVDKRLTVERNVITPRQTNGFGRKSFDQLRAFDSSGQTWNRQTRLPSRPPSKRARHKRWTSLARS